MNNGDAGLPAENFGANEPLGYLEAAARHLRISGVCPIRRLCLVPGRAWHLHSCYTNNHLGVRKCEPVLLGCELDLKWGKRGP